MPVSEEMVERIRHAYSQFVRGDIDTFGSLFEDGGFMIEAKGLPYGGVYKGSHEVKAALTEIVEKWWTDLDFDQHDFLVGDSHVAAFGELCATSRTSGEKIKSPLAEVWKIEDHKVVSLTPIYFDTATAAKALA